MSKLENKTGTTDIHTTEFNSWSSSLPEVLRANSTPSEPSERLDKVRGPTIPDTVDLSEVQQKDSLEGSLLRVQEQLHKLQLTPWGQAEAIGMQQAFGSLLTTAKELNDGHIDLALHSLQLSLSAIKRWDSLEGRTKSPEAKQSLQECWDDLLRCSNIFLNNPDEQLFQSQLHQSERQLQTAANLISRQTSRALVDAALAI